MSMVKEKCYFCTYFRSVFVNIQILYLCASLEIIMLILNFCLLWCSVFQNCLEIRVPLLWNFLAEIIKFRNFSALNLNYMSYIKLGCEFLTKEDEGANT